MCGPNANMIKYGFDQGLPRVTYLFPFPTWWWESSEMWPYSSFAAKALSSYHPFMIKASFFGLRNIERLEEWWEKRGQSLLGSKTDRDEEGFHQPQMKLEYFDCSDEICECRCGCKANSEVNKGPRGPAAFKACAMCAKKVCEKCRGGDHYDRCCH